MEPQSLERASQYLNNLLLARGLLSNGKPIDFACPERDRQPTSITMSRVINLVHDLILRRDQDAEQRDFLTTSIKTARAQENERVLDLQRLQDKNADLGRQAATAEAQQRTLKEVARKAEIQAKELKEQMLKMKSTLDQVRAKCLGDVRKRDVELEKLKTHLASMQRGKKEASGMKINTINFQPESKGREIRNGRDVNSADWGLEKETNDFLAALLNETSAENVSLRRIILETMDMLKQLTDLEQACENADEEEEDGIGIPGQYRKSRLKAAEANDFSLIPVDDLAEQMGLILQHCQSILKDPSFVPLEEVQVRDEEIVKLRAGWEKMASRWKEAVTMMDNWRRQKVEHGDGMSGQDLSNLEFGRSIATLPNGQPVFPTDDELSQILYDNNHLEMVEEVTEMSEHQALTEEREESDLEIPPEAASKRRGSISRRAGIGGKAIRPLQPVDINTNQSPHRMQMDEMSSRTSADSGIGSLDVVFYNENESSRPKSQSRIPRQAKRREEPVLTMSEKLAAVEAEAVEVQKPGEEGPRSRKRKLDQPQRPRRKGARRRSTLSPEELAELMGIV
ncbi:uncharacterized protein A1O9_06869 [Exophiala aquamarina CBS 119918]|uniref:NIMA interactive protein n=1 Tax=Exophiala aquamarina CBS 119918 TaxID=1182545 RepID=A0A072PMD3_9EURO|nr:uncharacterized protein A1O9_06869 [Exophiala aquamarina CBS 119918]KEF56680.1 hypothetical protein A1O9_06869 [Exophiala aquamarina CBS 119918]